MQPYDEVVEFIASCIPREAVTFEFSQQVCERVRDLLQREKTTGLSPEEKAELDRFEFVEHLMSVIKARARQLLA